MQKYVAERICHYQSNKREARGMMFGKRGFFEANTDEAAIVLFENQFSDLRGVYRLYRYIAPGKKEMLKDFIML